MRIPKCLLLFLVCSIILTLFACETKDEEEQSVPWLNSNLAEKIKEVESLPPLPEWWQRAYDLTPLTQHILQLKEEWLSSEQELSFAIQSGFEEHEPYQGLYRSSMDWELKGVTAQGEAFQLTKAEKDVILEYDQYKEELPEEEFHFLLPSKHIELISDLLLEAEYDYLTWEAAAKEHKIQLSIAATPILESFLAQIIGPMHSDSSLSIQDASSYRLIYQMRIKETEEDDLSLFSLLVFLEREGERLEEIIIYF